MPTNNILSLAGQALCQERAVIQELCANILFLIAGYDSEQLDRVNTQTYFENIEKVTIFQATLPILLATSPAGSSMKQFSHYAQEISTGTWKIFVDHFCFPSQLFHCFLD